MDMFQLVGKRIQVRRRDGRTIGLGTYLWNEEILLDTGKKILGSECVWEVVPASAVPPFEAVLLDDVRVFEGDGTLCISGYYLRQGNKVRIERIETCGWNHGQYVAGKFFAHGKDYWLLMSEVKLPKETPHLRLIS